MKKSLFIAALLLGIISYANAQIVVTSTNASSEKVNKVSYRGYVDVSGLFGTKGRLGYQLSTAHGIQFSPYIWAGIGVGYSRFSAKMDKFITTPSVSDFGGLEGVEQRNYNICTDNAKITLNSLPLFLELKVNMMPNKKIVPYISMAGGYAMGELGAYGQLKLGATYYNAKKVLGFSAFIGMEILPHYFGYSFTMYYEYKYSSWSNWESTRKRLDFEGYGYSLFFNIGVCLEFGGPAGLKPRVKK